MVYCSLMHAYRVIVCLYYILRWCQVYTRSLYTCAMSDIKSDEPKFLVCATPRFSADNAYLTIDEIMAGVVEGRLVYEALGFGPVKPYWDIELYYESEAEMLANHPIQLAACMVELGKLLGDTEGVMVVDASGQKKGKWIISLHAIANGHGCYKSGLDVKLADLVPVRDGFDQGVYKPKDKRQLMRLWGASKVGEDRPLRLVSGDKRVSLKTMMEGDMNQARKMFRNLLIGRVLGETLK